MEQQTAVEWLVEQLTEVDHGCINKTFLQNDNSLAGRKMREVFDQAKEIEAEQKNHFVELSKWLIESNRGVFEDADISYESKRKILNELGYSSGDY
jgi:hypothetical protein